VTLGFLVRLHDDENLYTGVVTFHTITKFIIAIWCTNLARKLNRKGRGWGVFGFFLPVLALLTIGFKKKIKGKTS